MQAPQASDPPASDVARTGHWLHPGQLFASAHPHAVSTILGTCVSICLFDPTTGVGGLNHFLLPTVARTQEPSSKFGNVAFQELIAAVAGLGARRSSLRAKVFGGLCPDAGSSSFGIGARNSSAAFALLRDESIPVMSQDVGGHKGRKLLFHTDTGEAWIRLL